MPRPNRGFVSSRVLLQTITVGACLLASGLLAQQAAHQDMTVSPIDTVNVNKGDSGASFSVNDNALSNRSSSSSRGGNIKRNNTASSSATKISVSRADRSSAASQVSSQMITDAGSIQSKSSSGDVTSSQQSTAQRSEVYASRKEANSNLVAAAAASPASSSAAHRSAFLNELAKAPIGERGGHHGAVGSTSVAPWTSHTSAGASPGKYSSESSQTGASSETGATRGSHTGHQSVLRQLKLRGPRSGLRRTNRTPGAPSVR